MKFPAREESPVFQINDDAECIKIARACGFDPELIRLRILEHARRSKEPSFGAVILDHQPQVLVLQFFDGYEHPHQNGWSILGFADLGVYAACLPRLLNQLFGDAHNLQCSPIIPAN